MKFLGLLSGGDVSESQRDFGLQPRVATQELPCVKGHIWVTTPTGLRPVGVPLNTVTERRSVTGLDRTISSQRPLVVQRYWRDGGPKPAASRRSVSGTVSRYSRPIARSMVSMPQPHWGWKKYGGSSPRVVSPTRQPWAEGHNPFGIAGTLCLCAPQFAPLANPALENSQL
jgi:hypothetical protein